MRRFSAITTITLIVQIPLLIGMRVRLFWILRRRLIFILVRRRMRSTVAIWLLDKTRQEAPGRFGQQTFSG